MVESRSGIFLCLVSLLFQSAAGNCNVCRNGGYVEDKNHNFEMVDEVAGTSFTWSCGYLEEALANVDAINGAPGEAFYCALAQLWADRECACSGDPAPPNDNVVDPNPACDLCGSIDGVERQLSFVPELLKNELVDTGIAGRMPCGGLYYALSEGILPSNLCPDVKRNAGHYCCSVPSLGAVAVQPVPEEVRCMDFAEECDDSGDCCGSLICRARGIGVPKICSAKPRNSRSSVAGRRGGSAGAAKFAN
jgi:hypothetical protein